MPRTNSLTGKAILLRKAPILCLALWSIDCVAQCRVPQFREGRTFVHGEDTVIESISMPLEAFRLGSLTCLAASMKDRYRGRKSILIYIYTSPEAAKQDVSPHEDDEWDIKASRQLHAFYMFGASKHEEYIKIMPAGGRGVVPDGPYSTRIDLPTKTAPHCRLEIDSRCLIAVDYVTYPDEALKSRESGTIALAATITRGGKTSKIRIVKMESASPEAESLLAKASIRNLSTWTFEPGREEQIEITYSYAIDDSLLHADGAQIKWGLPNRITISEKPPE